MRNSFNKKDKTAANKEGWDIFLVGFNLIHSPKYEIQRIDELGILESDKDAWKIIANGKESHHIKALKIIKSSNYREYANIMKYKNEAI